jgi:hypothetical protein
VAEEEEMTSTARRRRSKGTVRNKQRNDFFFCETLMFTNKNKKIKDRNEFGGRER